jgi:hypothetical protein
MASRLSTLGEKKLQLYQKKLCLYCEVSRKTDLIPNTVVWNAKGMKGEIIAGHNL